MECTLLTRTCRSLWAEIKSIVLHCIAFEGIMTISKILDCTVSMHTKLKFSICFFIVDSPKIHDYNNNRRKLRIKETLLIEKIQPQINLDGESQPIYLFNRY